MGSTKDASDSCRRMRGKWRLMLPSVVSKRALWLADMLCWAERAFARGRMRSWSTP